MIGIGTGAIALGAGAGNWAARDPVARNAHLYFSPATGRYAKNGAPVGFSQMGTFEAAGTRFERNSGGAYLPRGVDVPRVGDYSTGERRWLMEGSVDNLFPNPTSPEDWEVSDGVTVSGQRVSEIEASGLHRHGVGAMSVTSGQDYVAVVRFKPSPALRYCGLRCNLAGSYVSAAFDLLTLTATWTNPDYVAGIRQDEDGYVTVYASAQCNVTNAHVALFFSDTSILNDTFPTYVGDPSRYADVEYGQLQTGTYPTSMIASAATRAPEYFKSDLTGFDLSGGFGAFFHGTLHATSTLYDRVLDFGNPGGNDRYLLRHQESSDDLVLVHQTANVQQGNISTPYTRGNEFKAALLFGTGADATVFILNGDVIGTLSPASYGAPVELRVASNHDQSDNHPMRLDTAALDVFAYDHYSIAELQARTAA